MAKREVDDRFKKFGTVSFTSISKVNDFIDHLEKGKVMATKCKKCSRVFFPPRADCYNCLSSDMEWVEITGEGKLISFSELKYGPTGFENDLPYTIALTQFGDLKVFGRMNKDISESDIQVGMKVNISPLYLPNEKISYEFKKG
jgi:hypothetical protein